MAGFGPNRRATGIHDDLSARRLALQPGATPLVMCGVDSIGLFWDDEDYVAFVIQRAAEAAVDAIEHRQPATLKPAKARDAEVDTFIHDNRPPDVHDSELSMLRVSGKDGKPIGTLLNWANHPETPASKNTEITADYSGYLRARLEHLSGGTSVFVNGAVGGKQSPLGAKFENIPDSSFEKAKHIGERVAEIATEAPLGPAGR